MPLLIDERTARAIFALRGAARAVLVAPLFRVSEKTVRDIWKRRTWRSATAPPPPFVDPFAPDYRRFCALVAVLVRRHNSRP